MVNDVIASVAAPTAEGLFAQVLPWLLVLVALVMAGGVVIHLLRRNITHRGGGGRVGFTLQQLRELRAAGELSQEEFERARRAMISGLSSSGPARDEAARPRVDQPDNGDSGTVR